jgi:hypothetical protein
MRAKKKSPFLARLRVWDERRVNLSGTGGLPDSGTGDTFPSQGKNHLGMMRPKNYHREKSFRDDANNR